MARKIRFLALCIMNKHTLSNCGANFYLALHLGGALEDYQVNEDNVVFYNGERIGRWSGEMAANLDDRSLSINHVFVPDRSVESVTIDFITRKRDLK